MGWNFRKSIKVGPARINLSKSGVGYSVGAGGVRFSHSPKKKSRGKSGRGSMLKWMLYLAAFCVLFYLVVEFWYVLLILVAVVGLACGLLELHRRGGEKCVSEPSAEETSNTEGNSGNFSAYPKPSLQIEQEEENEHKSAIAAAVEERTAAFDAELAAIPKADIFLADPVPRRKLKDMPEYSFSNVTRTTRLNSIFPLVFLDVETTGLYPSKSEIIEVSAIKFDVGMIPVSCFSTLCKSRKPIPEEVTAINHITDTMVIGAPEFAQVAPSLNEFLRGCNIAGHNIDFDLRFIFAHGADFPENARVYDTLDLAHLTINKSEISGGYGLDSLCSYYGIYRSDSHRSLSDCYATSKVFTSIVQDKTERNLTEEF